MAHADAHSSTLDPCWQVKELVCQHLPLEDLRSARLASVAWCGAASSTVRVVCYSVEEDPLREVIAAFPHVTHVICQRGPPSVYRHWTNGSVVLLAADAQPAEEQQRTWYQKQWRVVIKPWGPACADSASQGLRYWHDRLPVVGSSASILAPAEAPLAPQWDFWAQRLPELTSLHTGLAYPVKPGRRGGLLGWGGFEGLSELHLHSTGGQPIRISDVDLQQLPQLQELQLSGNLTLSIGAEALRLQTSQLTSLTLQQVLSSTEAQHVRDSQPHLQHLSVLAPEPYSPTPLQARKWSSSVRSVEMLQGLVAWWEDDPGDEPAAALFGPGSLLLPHAKTALDCVLTPPGLGTPESVVEAMLPARRTARSPAATAAPHAALHAAPAQSAAAAVLQADARQSAAMAVLGADVQHLEGAIGQPHPLQHLTVHSGCWVELKPLLQLWSPQQLTICTLPAITDALQLSAGNSSLLGRYYFQVSAALFAGAIPGPLRVEFPMGFSLRVLEIDTSRTCAGVEVDDRTLLSISRSCRQLESLQIRALLRFGADGGAALRSLRNLQQLLLWDRRWQSVCFLLLLAADAPEDDMPEMRLIMSRMLQRTYYCVSVGGFAIAAALRGRTVLRAAALLGMAALALPVTAVCASGTVPLQHWQAARLCAAAAHRASRPPFVVRPCWLPPQLQQLQLHDCVLRCHKHCPSCSRSSDRQASSQLQVVELPAHCESPDNKLVSHRSNRGAWNRSSISSSSDKLQSRAAVRQLIRAGRQEGLYPSLWGLVARVLLAPCLPLAVTVAARAGLNLLLKRKRLGKH